MEILNYINEVWKPVRGYFNLYEASNYGRVRSLNYNHTGKTRLLSPGKTTGGYLQVVLYKDGKLKGFRVHRLVWEAFNGPIPEGMQINHLSEDKTDNRLENLSLVSAKENNNWGTRNERAGKGVAKAKSKMVEQYTLEGEHIMTWFSARGVERELGHLGVRECAISACCRGKQKTHKGYIWKYAEMEAV